MQADSSPLSHQELSSLLKHKSEHITSLHKTLQWFPLPLRVKPKVLRVAFEARPNTAAYYLCHHSSADVLGCFHLRAGAETLSRRSERLSPLTCLQNQVTVSVKPSLTILSMAVSTYLFAKSSHCLSKAFPDNLIHGCLHLLVCKIKSLSQ